MKLISEKYRKLKPRIEYLGDEVVIAQAWKKTHKYMRTHNWYADTLALDISALGLEGNASSWAVGIQRGDYSPYKLELVPAAKSEQWAIDEKKGWSPKDARDSELKRPPIRPLAHITVRDQTICTAIMLCLADVVESAQGDCGSVRLNQEINRRVYSYGNRLVCDWNDDGDAWFRWGNAETYRKFFTDYQNFLKRPIDVGRMVSDVRPAFDGVYVVNLDLERFYDNVDVPILIQRLKKLSEKQGESLCPDFWSRVEQHFSWEWDADSLECAKSLGIEIGRGLPQGLVASGFLANAYMIDFDRAIGKRVGETISESQGIVVHDYCRYVDDIRLVVSIEGSDLEVAAEKICGWVDKKLRKYAGEAIRLNSVKVKISPLSDLDSHGSISGRVNLLQQELSGPADRESLEHASAALEGLLSIQNDGIPDSKECPQDAALIRLARIDQDIRTDTLKRFAANRLERVMRNKRRMTSPGEPVNGNGETLTDNESELLSKKLVRAWMQDPSLGLVLRKSLEIFPSPLIAEPVFDAVYRRSSSGEASGDKNTAAMMDYILADIFRCCVDFNGYFQRYDYPYTSDPQGLLDVACEYAQKIVSSGRARKFLARQALLLLAVLQKPIALDNADDSIQHALHGILAGKLPSYGRQRLALFEVASQITGGESSYAKMLLRFIDNISEDDKYQVLQDLAKRGGVFWDALWRHLKRDERYSDLVSRLRWAAPEAVRLPRGKTQRLSTVISSSRNGFEHEAGLIKLALGLLGMRNKCGWEVSISPSDINVTIGRGYDWPDVWRPEVARVTCEFHESSACVEDPRFVCPPWVDDSTSDHGAIYWIGSILRSAVVGGNDFTGNRWRPGQITGYKGLRTGWYKRRMGMMHSAEALVGDYATVSTWLSDLLMTCLQWPGFEASHIQSKDVLLIEDVPSLEVALRARLQVLNSICCATSGMPTLITTINRNMRRKSEAFRIVTVQQMLPRSGDFTKGDPTLDGRRIRAISRDHLSRIALLTHKTLDAKMKADEDASPLSADMIVFPEVSVHADDQDILRLLAYKTKAIVFAGLIFRDYRGQLVNVARWFIPDIRSTGARWTIRDQGKAHMTADEVALGIQPHRPCQHIIEIVGHSEGPFRISGAICYDATDLRLATDLKGKTDLFIVCAHNKDVGTFDTMAAALNYHMYQHVAVVNKGEYGGSTIQAPYREHYDRIISHVHGGDQISINIADLDLAAFRRSTRSYKLVKARPAGTP